MIVLLLVLVIVVDVVRTVIALRGSAADRVRHANILAETQELRAKLLAFEIPPPPPPLPPAPVYAIVMRDQAPLAGLKARVEELLGRSAGEIIQHPTLHEYAYVITDQVRGVLTDVRNAALGRVRSGSPAQHDTAIAMLGPSVVLTPDWWHT